MGGGGGTTGNQGKDIGYSMFDPLNLLGAKNKEVAKYEEKKQEEKENKAKAEKKAELEAAKVASIDEENRRRKAAARNQTVFAGAGFQAEDTTGKRTLLGG